MKEKIGEKGPKSFYTKGKLAEDINQAYKIWLKSKLDKEKEEAGFAVRKHRYSFSAFINELLEAGLKEFFKNYKKR